MYFYSFDVYPIEICTLFNIYDVKIFFKAVPKVKALVGDFEKISTTQRKEAFPSSHFEKTGTYSLIFLKHIYDSVQHQFVICK